MEAERRFAAAMGGRAYNGQAMPKPAAAPSVQPTARPVPPGLLLGDLDTGGGIALDLPEYDSTVIHGSRISAAEIHRVSDLLLGLDHDGRMRLGVMHPGRVDVINAGVLVLRRILDATGLPEVLVSEHDILDGVCWALATP